MMYSTMVEIANSSTLQHRIAACAATEGVDGDPVTWAYERRWKFSAEPGWADAWQYAMDNATADDNPDIGARPAVINDEMILSAVQGLITPA